MLLPTTPVAVWTALAVDRFARLVGVTTATPVTVAMPLGVYVAAVAGIAAAPVIVPVKSVEITDAVHPTVPARVSDTTMPDRLAVAVVPGAASESAALAGAVMARPPPVTVTVVVESDEAVADAGNAIALASATEVAMTNGIREILDTSETLTCNFRGHEQTSKNKWVARNYRTSSRYLRELKLITSRLRISKYSSRCGNPSNGEILAGTFDGWRHRDSG